MQHAIEKLAKNDATVLISGETGSGKELAARSIHKRSARRHRPFIPINCGSIPTELFESELFGHEKGSFTSAFDSKPGKFELAHGGTLFLDEIGTLPLNMQAKLLRALQEKEIDRIGGINPVVVDVRIVAATNVDLKKEAEKGNFRNDLYHRLNVVPLRVPPLRERLDDIEQLVSSFLGEYGSRYDNHFRTIEDAALHSLKKYSWPGNIRELRHLMERIVALEEGPVLKQAHLPLELFSAGRGEYKGDSLNMIIENITKDIICDALSVHKGNHAKAARHLGLKRTTLVSKIKQLDLRPVYSA
jgi:transcriptional regulator with PAS, ATPase and Fis domain